MLKDNVEESSDTIGEPVDSSGIAQSEHCDALQESPVVLTGEGAANNLQQPVREMLVATAAKFLQTAKVADSDTFTKQLFLSKKGLTPLEIKESFVRAGLSYEEEVNIGDAPQATVPHWQLPPPSPYYPGPGAMQVAYPHYGAATSLWYRLKEFCNLLLFVTGTAYGVHYLYQHVIRPWLTGHRPPEALELQVVRLQAAVADSLVQLKSSVAALQQAVQGYTASAKSCPSCGSGSSSNSSPSLRQQLQQVQAEVTSLKSLMLNRRNFTPTPTLAPCIPAWQRSNGNGGSGAAVTNGRSAIAITSSSATKSGNTSATAISSSSATAISSSRATETSSSRATETRSSSPTETSSSSAASLNGAVSIINRAERVSSSGDPIAVIECTKDFFPPNNKAPVISSNPLSHCKDTASPPLKEQSRLSGSSNIPSSSSVTSDVIVSLPDQPTRTSSSDSVMYSDALDGSIINGVGSSEDLSNDL